MNRTFILLLAIPLLGCGVGSYELAKPNQRQPMKSPSGKYVLTLPIEPAKDGHRYWRLTISDINGHPIYQDDSPFVANLNVYWTWDQDDRAWLKNSDNGFVYYWEANKEGIWQRYLWKKCDNCINPPPQLL